MHRASLSGCKLLCGILIAAGLVGFACGDEQPVKKPSVWMRTKLEHSRKVLEGLAMEDFDTIAGSARSMNNLSELEKHVRANAPGYRVQLQFFRAANEELIKQADKKNLEGCALAFHQLTLSCVNCHKALRDKE